MKQTAVEWLDRWFRDNPEATHEEGNKALQQAKEMEKQQLNIARIDGINLANKGYGTKGSDEYPEIEGTMAICNDIISSQTEISDEDIEEYAKKNAFQYYEFITGAKWYREQLKQRQ